MDRIEAYKKIKHDSLNNKELGDSGNSIVAMLDSLIRSEELLKRLYDYFDHGYHLGYLLIQSQRIEALMVNIITQAENLRDLKSHNEGRKENLEKASLGNLIGYMEVHIESATSFEELRKFKDFRNKIVHKINEDFSVSFHEIENSIKEEYSPDSIFKMQHFLSEILKEINSEIFRMKLGVSEAEKIISLWDKNFQEKIGVSGFEFKIK